MLEKITKEAKFWTKKAEERYFVTICQITYDLSGLSRYAPRGYCEGPYPSCKFCQRVSQSEMYECNRNSKIKIESFATVT